MAFGKDPSVLQQTGSFRQRANALSQTRNNQRGGGGGSGGVGLYFIDEYKPSVGEPDMIRIIEGHYDIEVIVGEGDNAHVEKVDMPFFQYTEHFDGRHQKSCICSAGPWANNKAKRNPCYGCDIYWETRPEKGADGKRPKSRMSRSDKCVFTIIDYGRYHNVEDTDRDGQVRMNDTTHKPYMRWVKCEGVGCQACRAGKETKYGHARRWNAGWSHYNTIITADIAIGKSCRSCGSVNSIRGIAWLCGNASCGEPLVDMSTTNLKQADIDTLVARPMNCKCGYQGLPSEYFECMSCTPVGGVARRATIFDVDMNVQRVQSQGEGNGTTLLITQWSPPRPIDQNFMQYAKPLDLEKIYKPSTLENQAIQFHVTVGTQDANAPAQGRQPMNQQHRPYSEAGNLPPAPMGAPAGAMQHAQPYPPQNPYGQPPPGAPPQQQYAQPFAPQMPPQYGPPQMAPAGPMAPPQQQYQPPPAYQPPPQQYQQPAPGAFPQQYQQPPQAPPPQYQQPAAPPAYQPPPGFGGMMPPPKQ